MRYSRNSQTTRWRCKIQDIRCRGDQQFVVKIIKLLIERNVVFYGVVIYIYVIL